MRRLKALLAKFRRGESGASAVEFSIVATVFIVASMGVIEWGRTFQVRNEMAFAADKGARALMINSATATNQDIIDEVKNAFEGYDSTALNVVVTDETLNGVDYRRIELDYPMSIFIPGFTNTLTLKVTRRAVVL